MSAPETGPRLVIGEGGDRKDADLSRDLLLAFSQLIQVSRLHQLDNVALVAPLESVRQLTEACCGGGRHLHILADEDQVYANRRRVKFGTGTFQTIRELVRQFLQRGLAGFELRAPLSAEDLRVFLRAFHQVGREDPDPAGLLEQLLAAGGLTSVMLVRPSGPVEASTPTIELDAGRLAALLYAKVVVILRESLRSWEDEETRRYLGARAKRVIQQVITAAERAPRPFLWLVHVKDEEEHLYTHGANVALLSILLGLRLGLDRNRVCELGMAALFHDMGRISLPSDLLAKTGQFTAEEMSRMSRHPVHGVNLLLGLGTLNAALLQRLVVVFEHNIDSNGYPRQSWPTGLHIFSRIVAIADAYDAMTTRRSYRPARTPDEAMRELASGAGSRYDSDLVEVFKTVMGIYPLGTLVVLDTGEAGLVFHVDPSAAARPLVKLVLDGDGAPIEDGEIVDLSETAGDGSYRRRIVGTDDPHRLGVNVPSYLLAEEVA